MKHFSEILDTAKGKITTARSIATFIQSKHFIQFYAQCRREASWGEHVFSDAVVMIESMELEKLKAHVRLHTGDLSSLPTEKLRELCRQNSIKYFADMSKDEMAVALRGIKWTEETE